MFNTFFLQKRSTDTLLYSFPISLLILTIEWHVFTYILLNKYFKCSMVLDFSLRKLIEEYLKKSSTTRRKYLLPLLVLVCMGPIRSICRRSKGLVALIFLTFLCELLVFLRFMYSPQMGSKFHSEVLLSQEELFSAISI